MCRAFEAPYGYKVDKGSRHLEIEPTEAEAVRRVFELREMCPWLTLQEIADSLNVEDYKNRHGGEISAMLVKRILDKEEFYKGVYKYSLVKVKGVHEPII